MYISEYPRPVNVPGHGSLRVTAGMKIRIGVADYLPRVKSGRLKAGLEYRAEREIRVHPSVNYRFLCIPFPRPDKAIIEKVKVRRVCRNK